jgi:hypothetical protein
MIATYADLGTAMNKALLQGDPTRTAIFIADWLVNHESLGHVALCPSCNTAVKPRAEKNKKRKTHFAHAKGTGCPVVKSGRKPYEVFKSTPRTTAADARIIKQYALEHLESIYERAKDLCAELLWTEFLPLLEVATKEKCWAFKDFDTGYIPYMLLCCSAGFKGKRNSKRPQQIFFVLEPDAGGGNFWHLPAGQKQRIWRVNRAAKSIEDIAMVLQEVEPWYRKRARTLLKL